MFLINVMINIQVSINARVCSRVYVSVCDEGIGVLVVCLYMFAYWKYYCVVSMRVCACVHVSCNVDVGRCWCCILCA